MAGRRRTRRRPTREAGRRARTGIVLVVEPDVQLARSLGAALEAAGFRPVVAHSAVTGLAQARDRELDLVLLDGCLPDLDGLTLLGHLAAEPRTARLPVLVLDGGPEPSASAYRAAGARAVLARTADARTLLHAVRTHARRRARTGATAGRIADWEAGLTQGISRLVHADLDAHRVCQAVVDGAEALLGLAGASLWLLDGDGLALRVQSPLFATTPWTHPRLGTGEGLAGEVLRTGRPIVIADAARDVRTRNRASFAALGLRAFVAVPLVRDGRLLGVLSGARRSRRRFTPGDVQMLEALAEHATAVLEQARLLRESERRRQTAEALAALAAETSATQAAEAVLTRVLEYAERLVGAAVTYLALTDPGGDHAPVAVVRGHEHPEFAALRVHRSQGVTGWVLRETRPFRTADYLTDPRISHDLDHLIRAEGIRGVLAVPVPLNGRVAGVLWAGRRDSRPFTEDDAGILGQLAAQTAVALGNLELYREAQESRARLQAILDNAPAIIFVKDAAGRYVLVNRRFDVMVRITDGPVLGKTDHELFPKEVADAFRANDRKVWETGAPLEFEELAPHADGLHTSIVFKFPLVGPEGAVQAVCGIVTDITARKRTEAALRESEERMRQGQKMEAIGQLAGGIAHDFNNLLTAIAGYSELVLGQLVRGTPLSLDVGEIKRAAERGSDLIHQLLAFSRRQVLQPTVLSLNGVIGDLEVMLRRLIREDIALTTVLAAGLGCVRADRSQLEQVLINLVVNARDAMPSGGRLVIETANLELDEADVARHPVGEAGRYVLLAVTDTGCGMDAATQARVFEPFFTTKPRGEGTGLGLATVYGIVKQSGGYIWVYSEPGQGTTFKIYLPRVDERPTAVPPAARPPIPSRASETILLVEDDAAVRGLARRTLEEAGYWILEARDGEEALRVGESRADAIALLLTDVVMPGVGGRALAARLAAGRPGLKVLYMSGYSDNVALRQGALEPGAAFLPKPFTPAGLLRKVREVLDGTAVGAPDT